MQIPLSSSRFECERQLPDTGFALNDRATYYPLKLEQSSRLTIGSPRNLQQVPVCSLAATFAPFCRKPLRVHDRRHRAANVARPSLKCPSHR